MYPDLPGTEFRLFRADILSADLHIIIMLKKVAFLLHMQRILRFVCDMILSEAKVKIWYIKKVGMKMGNKIMKNIETAKVQVLTDLVAYQDGQVVSRTLVQNPHVGITLFAFDAGEEISSHESTGDALVYVLDGSANITVGENTYTPKKGESIVMPAGIPHAVKADGQFKMLLIVVFPF